MGGRRRYHHGNLAQALVDVASELAAEHGPDSVVLREVARRVGVSPAAAYRHFKGQEEILEAVKDRALGELGHQMRTRVAAESDRAERVLAAGRAYFGFGVTQPGLFACIVRGAGPDLRRLGPDDPLGQLVDLVTHLIGATAAREVSIALWASVHGLSMLCSGGALAGLDPAEKDRLLEVTLDVALRGARSLGSV